MTNLPRPQNLEETEHFRHRRQEEVAKIVQCGEEYSLNSDIEATCEGGLVIFSVIVEQPKQR